MTIRLKGKALADLNARIAERENNCCAICGAWVEEGVKAHHEPCGAGRKSDEYSKMILLCNKCHYARHNLANCNEIKEKAMIYLERYKGQA